MPRLLDAGHEIIAGTIGMGKSFRVVYNFIKSLIHNRPCCYIDPKGDTYRYILNFLATTLQGRTIWEALRDRIILVNPVSRSGSVVGFNAIHPMREFSYACPDGIALLSNSLVSHIRRQSGFELADANRMQNIMSAAIGLLAEGGKGQFTLAELPLLFVPPAQRAGKAGSSSPYNAFVSQLLPAVTHHGTLTFWQDQWPTWPGNARREWIQSTEGRIFQYLFDERVLTTVCMAQHGCLDFRQLVNEGYWLLVNIPYPLLSDTLTTLLGNLIVTNILYAAMQRPPGERSYRLILDEARFFNTGPLETILETARAYNLWLTLVVQSLDQMARMREGRVDQRLKETAINNCRYFSIFHNVADSQTFSHLMFPITGRVPTGIDAFGNFDWLPVAAEEDQNQRRFHNLGPREMIWFDKLSGEEPQIWRTPDVTMPAIDEAAIWELEAEHLAVTGVPISLVRSEIRDRQAAVRSTLAGASSDAIGDRLLPPASFGDWES